MNVWKIERSTKQYAPSFNKAVDLVARERKYLATVEGFSLESSLNYVTFMEEHDYPQYFAISDEDVVVGWCDITPKSIPEFRHVGVLGIGIIAPFRNQGIGRALLETTLQHAKKKSGVERVELLVFASNQRAIELYKKCGFEYEGEKRKVRKIDGRYENEIL
ncbi:acetyltransferase protein [Candidatus Moduliflexus flocculans]|uniref:Acetyltransferase protein n=1 Tax=Candidatus Moduliflexus flocculans TaxID=1499966 RepID=A0A0S6W0V3_9BACT|nr:acetyltransferase protein [Candidatus Moduliflexus flocculans]